MPERESVQGLRSCKGDHRSLAHNYNNHRPLTSLDGLPPKEFTTRSRGATRENSTHKRGKEGARSVSIACNLDT